MAHATGADDAAFARFLRERHFASLDGLRGLSIIPVVWHHAAGHMPGVWGRGHLGVQLFFAISGVLITSLLVRERAASGAVSLRNFYVRRTLRIFPLYYAVLALYVALVLLLERGTAPGQQFFVHLPAYLTYTSNWFVGLEHGGRVIFYFAWSLATEEQFYLVWPAVIAFSRSGWQPVLFMAGLLFAGEGVRWATGAGHLPGDALPVRMLASVATPICLGSLAALALHHARGFRVAHAVAGRPWSAPAAAALLAAAVAVDGTPGFLVAAAMTYLVVACVVLPAHPLHRVLESRALAYVGSVSYGIYLLHMLAVNVVRRALGPSQAPALTFALALPLAVGLAALSHRHFERRFLALKERFAARARPLPAAAPPEERRAATG